MQDLTDIFGTDIKVAPQPRQAKRQSVGFAGADGMTTMNMGTRGRLITVTGRLSYTCGAGEGYWNGRAALQAAIDAIESYQYLDGAHYIYDTEIYYNVIFGKFEIIPDSQGKLFHLSTGGKVFVNFVQILRSLT